MTLFYVESGKEPDGGLAETEEEQAKNAAALQLFGDSGRVDFETTIAGAILAWCDVNGSGEATSFTPTSIV